MNKVNSILALQNENFKIVGCTFDNSSRIYHYKTTLDVVEGERVVVVAPSTGLTTVTVETISDSTENDMRLKWIVSKIDTEYYEKCLEVEEQVIAEMQKAAKVRQVQKLIEELGEDGMEVIKGLTRL